MFALTRLRAWFPAALLVWTVLSAGCAQPLGPGFRYADRQTEIRAVPDAPGRLNLRVSDRLDNIGDRPIGALDVRLPVGPAFGGRYLRVTIGGKEVSLQRASGEDERLSRTPFDPAWEQRQSRQIVTESDLTPGAAGPGAAAAPVEASGAAFYIADETAMPLWQPPQGLFSTGDARPDRETLTVFAPRDFRVAASGTPLRQRTQGNLVAHSFGIRAAKDFLPFVVAGRYQEDVARAPGGSVTFWTFQPVEAAQARTAAARIASSMRAFTDFFGPALGKTPVIRIVEAPSELPDELGTPGDPGGASFPNGALLDHRAFAQGIASEAVLELAEYQLARTWFGWSVQPRPDARILLERGVGLFSLVVAAESRGEEERRRMATLLLQRYDEAQRAAPDRPLLGPPGGYSSAERVSTGYKAALFFVALEDLCGRDNVRAALRKIIGTLRGDDVGAAELRATVEAASQRDLAEMFRAWFNRPGVPDDFRARYAGSVTARERD